MQPLARRRDSERAAVLTKALLRAEEMLELTGARTAAILGTSESSMSRTRARARLIDPDSKEGELAALLIRLYRSLDALVGGEADQRLAWLSSYNRALNGVPAELIATAQGLVRVLAYLDGMRAPS